MSQDYSATELGAKQGSADNDEAGTTPVNTEGDALRTMATVVFTMVAQALAVGDTVRANELVFFGYESLAELNSQSDEATSTGRPPESAQSRLPAGLLIAATIAQNAASPENIRTQLALDLALRALAFIEDKPTHPVGALSVMINVSAVLSVHGQHQEAYAVLSKALGVARADVDAEDPAMSQALVQVLSRLADLEGQFGREQVRSRYLDELIGLALSAGERDVRDADRAMVVAQTMVGANRWADALACFDFALGVFEAHLSTCSCETDPQSFGLAAARLVRAMREKAYACQAFGDVQSARQIADGILRRFGFFCTELPMPSAEAMMEAAGKP
jgi:hypothetical protein